VDLIALKLQKVIISKFQLHNMSIASKKAKLVHNESAVNSLFSTVDMHSYNTMQWWNRGK